MAVIACMVTFVVNFIGTINFVFAVYKSQNVPMPTIPEGAHVEIVSMWPTYIYAVTSVLLLLLLTRNSIKKAFNK